MNIYKVLCHISLTLYFNMILHFYGILDFTLNIVEELSGLGQIGVKRKQFKVTKYPSLTNC